MSMAYVGVAQPCGHWVAACVDLPDSKRDTARFVADCVRDGLEVIRVDVEQVRVQLGGCEKCCPKAFKKRDGEQLALEVAR